MRPLASFHIRGTLHFCNESEISRVRNAPVDEAVSFSIRALTTSCPVTFEVSRLLRILISSCVIGMSLSRASVLNMTGISVWLLSSFDKAQSRHH